MPNSGAAAARGTDTRETGDDGRRFTASVPVEKYREDRQGATDDWGVARSRSNYGLPR